MTLILHLCRRNGHRRGEEKWVAHQQLAYLATAEFINHHRLVLIFIGCFASCISLSIHLEAFSW